MPTLRIGLRENRTAYAPGDTLSGAALWELDRAPKTAEIHLCWSTRGKGSEDAEVVATIPFDAPQAGDTREFTFTLPPGPYSFSGKLISLIWSVELVLKPGKHTAREEIVIAPGGTEIVLPRRSEGLNRKTAMKSPRNTRRDTEKEGPNSSPNR